MAILGFADKETAKVFSRQFSRRIPSDIQQTALRRLIYLDKAQNLNDLRVPPSNRLEPLQWDRAGQYSIRVNDKYRICFTWVLADLMMSWLSADYRKELHGTNAMTQQEFIELLISVCEAPRPVTRRGESITFFSINAEGPKPISLKAKETGFESQRKLFHSELPSEPCSDWSPPSEGRVDFPTTAAGASFPMTKTSPRSYRRLGSAGFQTVPKAAPERTE